MPRTIGRDLNLCFIKIKSPLAICNSSSSSPNTDHDHQDRPCATTNNRTSNASANFRSSTFIKNFNSLYDNTVECTYKSLTQTSSSLSNTSIATASASTSSREHEPEPEPEPADFATAFASKRFFFSSPGRSNSIIESTSSTIDCCIYSSSTSRSSSMAVTLPDDRNRKLIIDSSVAVHTHSPDPYADFRRSMQEMVEARTTTDALMDVKSNWEFLHELLQCYLALNPRNTHKFIIGAFADLLVSLMHLQGKTLDDDMAVVNGDGSE